MIARIQNYQSAEDLSLQVKGFTVLVGQNNHGKSAIRRAVQSVFSNSPGHSFVTWGKENALIQLEFDDYKLSWKKGEDRTEYRLIKDGKEKVFNSPGREVPPEIAGLGFSPVKLTSGQKLNVLFAGLDWLFLLNSPGPVVAEVITLATRLNQISYANKLCVKDSKSIKSVLKIREEDLKKVNFKLETLEDVPSLVSKNIALQKQQETFNQLESQKKYLETALSLLAVFEERVQRLSEVETISLPKDTWTNLATELDQFELFSNEFEARQQKVKTLSKVEIILPEFQSDDLADDIDSLKEFMESLDGSLEGIKRMEALGDFELPSIDLQSNLASLNSFDELVSNLDKQCRDTFEIQKRFKDVEAEHAKLEKELSDLGITTCPICDRPMP